MLTVQLGISSWQTHCQGVVRCCSEKGPYAVEEDLERETTQEPTTVLFANVMMQLRMSSHYAEQLNHWIHIINRDAEGAVKCCS